MAYDVAALTSVLEKAIDKHVVVEILLKTSSNRGGKVTVDSIGSFKESLPSARIYIWDREDRSEEWSNGAVHVKCAVAVAEDLHAELER